MKTSCTCSKLIGISKQRQRPLHTPHYMKRVHYKKMIPSILWHKSELRTWGHIRPLLCCGEDAWFSYFQNFCSYDTLTYVLMKTFVLVFNVFCKIYNKVLPFILMNMFSKVMIIWIFLFFILKLFVVNILN